MSSFSAIILYCDTCGRMFVAHAGAVSQWVNNQEQHVHYQPGRHPQDEILAAAAAADEAEGNGLHGPPSSPRLPRYSAAWKEATCSGAVREIDRPEVLAAWKLGGDAAVAAINEAECRACSGTTGP